MSVRLARILIACLAAGAALVLLLRLMTVAMAQPETAVPSLAQPEGTENNASGAVDVIIHMAAAADLASITRIADVGQRRVALITQLKAVAENSQAPLLAELAALEKTSRARNIRPLWIVNAVAATVAPELIPQLTTIPGVAEVAPDSRHKAFGEPTADIPGASNAIDFQFAGWAAPPAAEPGQAANWSLEAVRAPAVWNLLGIDGRGVTVAIVDTGVDWQHPALRNNYRGGRGETAIHAGNWYSSVYPTQTVPIDQHGHGTHVAGTAVGHRGLGVAPGAEWIAVAIADEHGRIRDSDVHAAYEWLLAPNGDPALAPDVVNNSWGATGDYTAFEEDVRVLEAAGIVAVFAAGNTGPGAGSINAPASYPGAISVAATDPAGAITWFSSRGPSPLTTEPKPLLSAPGAQILSAFPANRYALMNGTSMATPHVSGAAALMLSAEPRLTAQDVKNRLVAAAGNSVHDPSRGWGRLDAYALVAPLAATGTLAGQVTGAAGAGLAATITVTTPAGHEVALATDPQGRYEVAAMPGQYHLQATAFAFSPGPIEPINVIPGHVVVGDIALEPLPAGNLSLRLFHRETGASLEGDLLITTAAGHPVPEPVLQPDGRYVITLPTGQYHVAARVPDFRFQSAEVTIGADQTFFVDLPLEPGPRLLLIDSGPWQYRSQVAYYDQALEDNGYFADRWSINNPFDPLPTLQQLAAYDAVLWSAPNDSPGYLGANDVITDYLGIGGRLLIAGQNVANYDGTDGMMAIWWARQLEAVWLSDSAPDEPLHGAPDTPFVAHQLTLNGADSAGNQTAPDRVAPRNRSLTQPVLLYPDGTAAALLSRRCEPFRLLYFGFGLESVTGRDERAALMQTSLDVLLGADERQAAVWQPAQVADFALGGDRRAYTVTLRNLNPVLTQTFAIDTTGGWWPRAILSPTLTIPPCGAADTVVTIDVPPGLPPDDQHQFALTARAQTGEPLAPAALPIDHKTPGHVLLVDDDRFVQAEGAYRRALDELGVKYDVWETGWPFDLRGSPQAAFLRAYDLVIWFTGYDWFQPLTSAESAALVDYLEQGGHLFLSSQDFLYRNAVSPLARDYLGVASYQESITPTLVFFDEQFDVAPELAGAQPLAYGAYQNYSDGLAPGAGGRPFLWHNQGAPAAMAAGGVGAAGRPWRSVFWAFPFETLPAERQTAAMDAVLDYLSDLGDSSFTVDRRSGPASELRVFSLTVANHADDARRVWVTNTLPISLSFHSSTTSDLTFERAKRRLTWSGVLAAGEVKSLAYTAAVSPRDGHSRRIDNTFFIGYTLQTATESSAPFAHHRLIKTTTTWIDAPDLTTSSLTAHSSSHAGTSPAGDPVVVQSMTYTLLLRNSAAYATRPMTATLSLPQSLEALEESLAASQGAMRLEAWRAIWNGTLLPGETVTASVTMTRTAEATGVYPAVAYLDDGVTATTLHPLFYVPLPRRAFLPVALGPR